MSHESWLTLSAVAFSQASTINSPADATALLASQLTIKGSVLIGS